MWDYFERLGIKDSTLNFFIENAMPPDIMGFNYYITSERYLDDDLKKYPLHAHGSNEIQDYADVEAIRINHGNPFGLTVLLEEAWKRYKIPIAITEAHLNSGREDQLRWLNEIVNSCYDAQEIGIDIKAVTFWSLFGAYGWNKLLTNKNMDYEPGAFDLRSIEPRPTAIAAFIKNMVLEKSDAHPIINQKGWWHQKNRFHKKDNSSKLLINEYLPGSPVLITGKTGTLGQAFAKICDARNIKYILTGREDFDITNEENVYVFLDQQKPWAIINTAGFVNVDGAQELPKQCFEVNSTAAGLLSKACLEKHILFVSFSSDLVFDGEKKGPYFETDAAAPLNIYGASKAMAEEVILRENPDALIIRTSAFFGPWDRYNFVFSTLNSLFENKEVLAADDLLISPTYVPHLVAATLELLMDNESGIWHLTNVGALSWKQLAARVATKAGYDESLIAGVESSGLNLKADRPLNSALRSQRGSLMPSLDHAINCFFNECITLPKVVQKFQHT